MEKIFSTELGDIHYWVQIKADSPLTLVFLPGLTADHRLFDRQIEFFKDRFSTFVWDAPGHAASRPFALQFSLADKAKWLMEILKKEEIADFVLIGQSMGGYVSQMFMQLFSGVAKGFVSIDSAPLQRKFVTAAELWLLKRTEPLYSVYPWKALVLAGSAGCAVTEYGRKLMAEMMLGYEGGKKDYVALVGHGYRMLAEAMEADLPYEIDCPALLLCGEKDMAGSTKRYNRAWSREVGVPLVWIPNAGHNSNTDQPETVNALLDKFIQTEVLSKKQ